jgi:2-methylcitrate dehydratase PrpD
MEKAKEIALHSLGVQLAGSTLPWSRQVYRYVRGQGQSSESTVVNYGFKTSAVNAAFANGTFGHGFEMDDNHGTTGIKGGCVVVPPALAIGESQASSGKELILAIVAGYEVMTRIGLSVRRPLIDKGRHPTGSSGPFGAAVCAGKLLGFDEKTMLHAISIAAGHSAGIVEAPPGGRGNLKRIFGGMAASSGIRAALLAREGLTGPETMLEGKQGYCYAFGDTSNLGVLTAGLGTEWQILHAHYKVYAQDGYIQPMTEALDRIVKQHRFDPDNVEEIRAGTNTHAYHHMVADIREPNDLTSAQFSTNFSLALFLIKGGAGFHEYTEDSLSDPAIKALSRKIHTELDEEVDQEWRKLQSRGARITVRLKTGETYTDFVHQLRAMTPEDVNEKFRRLATVAVTTTQCEQLLTAMRNLETVSGTANLIPLLTSGNQQAATA